MHVIRGTAVWVLVCANVGVCDGFCVRAGFYVGVCIFGVCIFGIYIFGVGGVGVGISVVICGYLHYYKYDMTMALDVCKDDIIYIYIYVYLYIYVYYIYILLSRTKIMYTNM